MKTAATSTNRIAAAALIFSLGQLSAFDQGDTVRFNRDIRPILADRCFTCHGPDNGNRKADLRLDQREQALQSAIAEGDPDASELIRRVTSTDPEERMPPESSHRAPLNDNEIELLRDWIQQGAVYEQHWSLAPITSPPIPVTATRNWPISPLDAFILAKIEAAQLAPSKEADPVLLVRRLYLDLLGLPPRPEDVAQFQAEDRADSVDRLVDRLLASPHLGERLAVFWLDLVRFADTVGYHGDQEHHISPYRDYVIESFNRNLPFDTFTAEQLAGDLIPGSNVWQQIATGYNRVLQTSHEGGVQAEEYLAKYSADRVRNVSSVWLGLTMGCAECHDHKFDPLSQKDFYSLAAFFADIEEKGDFKGAGDTNPTKRHPEMDVYSIADQDEIDGHRLAIASLDREISVCLWTLCSTDQPSSTNSALSEAEALYKRRESVQSRLNELLKRKRRTMITRAAKPRDIRVLARGDWMDKSGAVVSPAIPEVFEKVTADDGRRLNRLDLANWLTSTSNPLTARVFVNRLWCQLLGEGLSKSLEDAGSQGEWPTHPDLLDFLASEFAGTWDIKAVVRTIATSATYRLTSRPTAELATRDPSNRLFARQSSVRLPAEVIRDQALSLSGLLVHEVGGRSAHPYQPKGYYRHLNFPEREYVEDKGASLFRRTVYSHWQRQYLHPMLKAFDAPSREECTARRVVSNTPLAALALLNDPQFVEAARGFAQRILATRSDADRLDWAWMQAMFRPPAPEEKRVIEKLLRDHRAYFQENSERARALASVGSTAVSERDLVEVAAWTSVARVLFNLDEVVTRQ